MNPSDKIFVAGHEGMLGRALCSLLKQRGFSNVVTASRNSLDLRIPEAVKRFFCQERPSVVLLAAARVGGILANSLHGSMFLRDNLRIQDAVLWGAHEANVRRLVFVGSSCIYPRDAMQPIEESALLSGPLEETNRPYALAKIAGIELVRLLRQKHGRDYFSVMPTNLYGPNDKYHAAWSHVLPALIRRIAEAKMQGLSHVTIWGTGTPQREFMHVRDCADAMLHLVAHADAEFFAQHGHTHVNIGSGDEVTIRDAAELIAKIVGFTGDLVFDSTMPDGTPRKLLDSSALRSLGWAPSIVFRDGLQSTVADYIKTVGLSDIPTLSLQQ